MLKKYTRRSFGICILWILFLGISLSGCTNEHGEEVMTPNPEQGQYVLYYRNQDKTELVQASYSTQTDSTKAKDLVIELYEQLQKQPEDIAQTLAVPQKLNMPKVSIDNEFLCLSFDDSYVDMETNEEILCRAALVKTFVQIPDISYVSIKINGQPLLDVDGNAVGTMTDESFIDSAERNINAMQSANLVLYYTNETGDELVEVDRQVLYDSNISMEKLVLNLLIQGPSSEGVYPTLPKDLTILGVSVKDGICCVNFNSTFLTDALDVADYIPIYSIVNSLVELNSVTEVQITVNGSADVKFKDTIPLTEVFERNLDYVGDMQIELDISEETVVEHLQK